MDTSDLGKRMKRYENANNPTLIDNLPVVLRLDGVNFHSFTKRMIKPFDPLLSKTMQLTMLELCKNISGCEFGYTQSDEITLVLVDYDNPLKQPWVGYVKRKMESVAAAMATKEFNKLFIAGLYNYLKSNNLTEEMVDSYDSKIGEAMFDCRAFNLPLYEVENNLIWRQCDCIRNSILSVGQSNFPESRLRNKNCKQIREMLFVEKGIEWDDLPTYLKIGSCAVKKEVFVKCENGKQTRLTADGENETGVWRNKWILDEEIPIFKEADREYIRSRIKL